MAVPVDDQTVEKAVTIPLAQLPEVPTISLQQAARDGREDIVRQWVDQKHHRGKASRNIINGKDADGFTALHHAARFNRFKIMQLLITRDADPNVKCPDGLTPLHYSAKYLPPYQTGDLNVDEESQGEVTNLSTSLQAVQLLIWKKCDVNIQDKNSSTPLHLACSRGNRAAVHVLLQAPDIDVNITDYQLHTPLHNACLLGDTWIADQLLQKGADFLASNDDGLTPLHMACEEGQTEIVKLILKYGINYKDQLVQAIDTKLNTPLHLACDSGVVDVVQALLLHSANAYAANIRSVTPMHIAAQKGHTGIAAILLDSDPSNIEVQDRRQMQPLHHAAKHNQVEMIEFLLQKGADMNALDVDSHTPFLSAAYHGQVEAFRCLLERGAPVDAVDKNRKSCVFLAAKYNYTAILEVLVQNTNGRKLCRGADVHLNTPLHIAAKFGHIAAAKVLLKAEIKMDARNEASKTPLHLASEKGHLKMVKLLVSHDRQQRQKLQEYNLITCDEDQDLNTPLHLASASGHYDVAKYLLEIHADPNAKNTWLRTPLHSAAKGGWAKVAKELIKAEADVDAEDKRSITPFYLACQEGHLKTAEVLMKAGAKVTATSQGLNCLDIAVENGQEEVAMAIIQSNCWTDALKNCTEQTDTPMRRLIRKMPVVAEAVFNRCTTVSSGPKIAADSPEYEVAFNFEFLEDCSYKEVSVLDEVLSPALNRASRYIILNSSMWEEDGEDGGDTEDRQDRKLWATSWGPPGFKKSNHPLSIMVESEQTNLLKHPLVNALLDYKWRKYTQLAFAINMLIYFTFVVLLTSFALVVHTPQDRACVAVFNSNVSGPVCAGQFKAGYIPSDFNDGDKPDSQYWFLFIAAVIIVALGLTRLIMEMIQFILRRLNYIKDWINWMENLIFAFSIVFVWVFHTDCYCQYSWQWQIGVMAVFLAWINMIIFISKLPLTGIYVVMFLDIFYTFMRMVLLSLLLVLSFSFAFYMLFYKPDLQVLTPFASPGRTIIKTMTMTTGEFEFDTIFQQGGDSTEDVPFFPVSVILWIIFIILMPILLTNLLVGLAVDDIKGIQEAATLKRLELQVCKIIFVIHIHTVHLAGTQLHK